MNSESVPSGTLNIVSPSNFAITPRGRKHAPHCAKKETEGQVSNLSADTKLITEGVGIRTHVCRTPEPSAKHHAEAPQFRGTQRHTRVIAKTPGTGTLRSLRLRKFPAVPALKSGAGRVGGPRPWKSDQKTNRRLRIPKGFAERH